MTIEFKYTWRHYDPEQLPSFSDKEIPVIGPAAKFANSMRRGLLEMGHANTRKNALLRMKHRVSWYISRNPQSQKQFDRHTPMLTAGQRELVESLTTKGVAAASYDRAGIDSRDWSALQEVIDRVRPSVNGPHRCRHGLLFG